MDAFRRASFIGCFSLGIRQSPVFFPAVQLLVRCAILSGLFALTLSHLLFAPPHGISICVFFKVDIRIATSCCKASVIRVPGCHTCIGHTEESLTAFFSGSFSMFKNRTANQISKWRAGVSSLLLLSRYRISNLAGLFIKHRLSLVPCTAVNDANMMVFYIIARCLTFVDRGPMGQEILCDGLLHLNVTHIFFIPKNCEHRTCRPVLFVHRLSAKFIQLLCNTVCRLSTYIPFKNITNRFCLLRIDHPLAVGAFVISQHPIKIHLGLSSLKIFLDRPADIVRNGPALILRQCGKNSQNQFTGRIQRVDILFFKVNTNRRILLPKLADTIQGVHRVSGKS